MQDHSCTVLRKSATSWAWVARSRQDEAKGIPSFEEASCIDFKFSLAPCSSTDFVIIEVIVVAFVAITDAAIEFVIATAELIEEAAGLSWTEVLIKKASCPTSPATQPNPQILFALFIALVNLEALKPLILELIAAVGAQQSQFQRYLIREFYLREKGSLGLLFVDLSFIKVPIYFGKL